MSMVETEGAEEAMILSEKDIETLLWYFSEERWLKCEQGWFAKQRPWELFTTAQIQEILDATARDVLEASNPTGV